MAVEYKTTTTTKLKNSVSGFAYSVVPAGTNVAGTTWKVALTEFLTDRDGDTASKAPSLPAAVTQVELDAGDFVEWPFTVDTLNADDTDIDKETELQAQLLVKEVDILADLQAQLNFWGREGQATV